MPELVVLVGLQASGKSSFYRARFATTHVLVSKDLLRNARNKERRQAALLEEALAEGRDVVVDNTNPTVDERARLIAAGRAHGARIVGYWFPVSVSEAITRNSRREGRALVPLVGILATAKKFQPPTAAEGFGVLWLVRLAGGNSFEVLPFDGPAGTAPAAAY